MHVFPPTKLYGFQSVVCNPVKLKNNRNDLFLLNYNKGVRRSASSL